MVIGLLIAHLYLPGSDSLKAKRQVIQSLKARLKNNFNISIAEVGKLNSKKEAEMGVVCVSNSGAYIDGQLSRIMSRITAEPRVEVINYSTEKI